MYFLPSTFTNSAAENIRVIFNFFSANVGEFFLYVYLDVKLLDGNVSTFKIPLLPNCFRKGHKNLYGNLYGSCV